MSLPQVNTLVDDNGLLRAVFNSVPKTIVDGSATSLFQADCPSGKACSGLLLYNVYAADGTDQQCMAGLVSYSAVNKAGTLTLNVGYATANDSKAVSSGTLTLSFTAAANTGNTAAVIKLQPTGSLTETTYQIIYSVFPLRGRVDLL